MPSVFKDSWGVLTDDISHVHSLAKILELWDNDDFLAEAKRRFGIGVIIRQHGTWAVTDLGMGCLVQYYPIEKTRLYKDEPYYSWVRHMIETKRWCNLRDFAECLTYARFYHDPDMKTYPGRLKKKAPKVKEVKERPPLAPKARFEILKRDGYACRVCGVSAYDGATLNVDHVVAVANGGTNDKLNLMTLCTTCNFGKGVDDL